MQRKILQGEDEKRNGIYFEYDPYSKPIGEGGMGVVYKGFRVNASTGVRQVVAIKAMKDGLPDEVYGRACREANIRLKNDNLVEMIGLISTIEQERGGRSIRRYYVISEFLNGVVLTDLLKGNFKNHDGIEIPFAKQLYTDYITDRESTAVEIVKRVLAGIMALHDRKYIHRDIDPSNIMVTTEGNLKIIDFGIAKYVGELGTQDNLRTSTGKFIGKAEYASPELVLGDVRNQHFTTDIYAIGIFFYQLLVGDLPFSGSQYDIMQAQLNKSIPIRKVHYNEYRSIIKKATAKTQSERYQSCIEMRLAIDNAHPVTAWKKNLKIAAIFIGICAFGYCGYLLLPNPQPAPPNPKPKPIIIKDYRAEQYENALKLLDSNNVEAAKEGWKQMMALADSGYNKAIGEVGITYFIHEKVENTVTVSKRRGVLGLGEKDDLEKSVALLRSIKDSADITGEELAFLGLGIFRTARQPSDYKEAKDILLRAKDALSTKDSIKNPLYEKVQYYIKQCDEDK